MKNLKSKLALLAVCSSLMIPSAVSAATEKTDAPHYTYKEGIYSTFVDGIDVPGRYTHIDKNARVAYIPGGVGLVVVDKDAPIPKGSFYLKKVDDRIVAYE